MFQISNLSLHFKKLRKEENKPNTGRTKEIIKIRVEINEIEKRKTLEKINER